MVTSLTLNFSINSSARIGQATFAPETKDRELVVSPNPNAGSFEACFYLPDNGPATLTVTDVIGRIWHSLPVSGRGRHQKTIHLPAEASGVFVMILKTSTDIETRKIVVAR
ncbi:hypothetical protein GCM10023091_11530 [Ravibacter arvi]|uniref:Secretion system C-terminal sorting domain-containing protein n=1 Tax=Ravibacter arvi TaxID=2051041 RepID=A0ABP8LS27_9BACT